MKRLIVVAAGLALGCSETESQDGGGDGGPPIDDAEDSTTSDVATDDTLTADGVTGGTFSSDDGELVIVVPGNAIPPTLSAQPQIESTDLPTEALEDGETAVAGAFDVDLNATGDFVTTASVSITLALDLAGVPEGDRDALHVYAKAYDPDSGNTLRVLGDVNATDLVLTTRGVPNRVILTAAYDPDMTYVSSAPNKSARPKAATQWPPWATQTWVVVYTPNHASLRSNVASILSLSVADVTAEQIASVLQERVTANAVLAGTIYEAAGFRQPDMQLFNGTLAAGPYFVVNMYLGGSEFRWGDPFGQLYINYDRLDDTSADELGTVRASVAHELFHGVQYGYDIPDSDRSLGVDEGSAATYGVTIDQNATSPQVRTANDTEVMLLNSYLGRPNDKNAAGRSVNSRAYANQDFFAYVGRVYNSNSLAYIKAIYEGIRSAVVAATAPGAAAAPPTWKMVWDAIDGALTSTVGQSLATVYFQFARDRALLHEAPSRLRSSDPQTYGLDEVLFSANKVVKKTVNPNLMRVNGEDGTIAAVSAFSSAVIVFTPSDVIDSDEDDLDVYLEISPATVKAALYRQGVETLISGKTLIADFGRSTNDVLTVLVSNVSSVALSQDVTYSLGPQEGTDSFTATIEIDGTDYPFATQYVHGGFGKVNCYEGSAKCWSNLPSIVALDKSLAQMATAQTVGISTDPARITEGVAATFGDLSDVFVTAPTAAAYLNFATPELTQATNDGYTVLFESTSGSITFSEYSTVVGERLVGTYSATIAGDRCIAADPEESWKCADGAEETLLGTISGTFDVALVAAE